MGEVSEDHHGRSHSLQKPLGASWYLGTSLGLMLIRHVSKYNQCNDFVVEGVGVLRVRSGGAP